MGTDNGEQDQVVPVTAFGNPRPSPSKCTICYELLLQFSSCLHPGETPSLQPMVALKCGHLFHTECINKWFMTLRGQEFKICPYCSREMWANEIMRIFPISGGPGA